METKENVKSSNLPSGGTDNGRSTVIIGFYIEKGGAGKTTLSFNLAEVIASQGFKVAILDFDAQCSLSKNWLGMNKYDVEDPTVPYDSLLNLIGYDTEYTEEGGRTVNVHIPKKDARTLLTAVRDFPLDTIRSTSYIQSYLGDSAVVDDPTLLRDSLDVLRGLYDFIFLDMAPGYDATTRACLVACDYVVCPTDTDQINLDGVDKLLRLYIPDCNRYNPYTKCLGILVNMCMAVDKKGMDFEDQELKNLAKMTGTYIFSNHIKMSVDIKSLTRPALYYDEAHKDGPIAVDDPIFLKGRRRAVYKLFRDTADELMGRIIELEGGNN